MSKNLEDYQLSPYTLEETIDLVGNARVTRRKVLTGLATTLFSLSGLAKVSSAEKKQANDTDFPKNPEWSKKHQSPIDISNVDIKNRDPKSLVIDYKTLSHLHIVKSEHTLKDELKSSGSTLTVDGHMFTLDQFHFHAPAEHTIKGKQHDAVMHFVHYDTDENIAVMAVFADAGKHNPDIQTILDSAPKSKEGDSDTDTEVDLNHFIPDNRTHYEYDGTTTTSPYVPAKWFIFNTPIEMSQKQINDLHAIFHDNNRDIQHHPEHVEIVVSP